jgi:cell division protein FtsN
MNRGKKIQVNFLPIIVIICLSICAGYVTAKYVVYPFLGYEPTGLNLTKPKATQATKAPTTKSTQETTTTATKSTDVVDNTANVTRKSGYALQFGSYSTKAAAEKSVADLKTSGIKAEIVQKDGDYKVIGELFDTKQKAKAALAELDASQGAFITTVQQ